jgi:hypothetical protein
VLGGRACGCGDRQPSRVQIPEVVQASDPERKVRERLEWGCIAALHPCDSNPSG